MPLSDTAVRNAKAREKPYKIADSGGLYVLVQPTGSRLWRMDYRHNGLRKTLAFGAYPVLSLADARSKRDTAKRSLADGIDPKEAKRADTGSTDKPVCTFGSVVKDYLERLEHDGAASATMDKNRWLLETLAASLASRSISAITPADVLAVLQKVEATGRLESAVRLRSAISAVFRLAVVKLLAANDPTLALRGATKSPKTVNRAAITDPKKLGWLMNSINGYDGWPTLRCALQFIALTAARPGEVRSAEWQEVDFKKAKWTIPAVRTKMRREHDIPLSLQAVAVLDDVRRITGDGKLIFSSIRSEDRPLSENAMNSALRRMGVTEDEHTAHGFRSSFSTVLNQKDFDPEIVEMCLAHQDGNKVRRAYNRSTRWAERVKMMKDWADLLDQFRVMK